MSIWPTEIIGVAAFYVDDEDMVYIPKHNAGMISLVTLDGERLARWGNEIHYTTNCIWCDSHKNIYPAQPGEWGSIRRIIKYERLLLQQSESSQFRAEGADLPTTLSNCCSQSRRSFSISSRFRWSFIFLPIAVPRSRSFRDGVRFWPATAAPFSYI